MTFPSTHPLRPPQYKGSTEQTLYIPMRDGVHLAADLYLPRGLTPTTQITALFAATRYWRAQQLKSPFAWFLSLPDSARNFFTAFGYAVLRIDLRGTGASEGHHPHPWPATDLTDLYDLTEWVIKQPWSNGQVGGFGNSYQATTAEMLGACGHPAVTFALVRFNEYDVYTDIAFPGGVPNKFMLIRWAEYNRALDANQLPPSMSAPEKLIVKGVKPIGTHPIPIHHNHQVDSALRHITYRDDLDPELGICLDDISIHTRPTTHTLDHWGSWFDAATADAVIRRFANNPRPQRAVIGAWNHGATQHVGTKENPLPLQAQMQESLRFFDTPPTTRTLHYFTLFENSWQTTDLFPPTGLTTTRFYFQPQQGLATTLPPSQPADHFEVDFSVSTGVNNRWQTELDQRPVKYAPIRGQLTYSTAPLEQDTEITGYPIVTLFIQSTHTDGNFFVYLEAIDEQGHSHYLSEGMLRAIHRQVATEAPPYQQFVPYHSFKRADALPLVPGDVAELTFGLNPISALLRRDWRLRVSLTGADKDTFQQIPATGRPGVQILIGGEQASFIEIPQKLR
ncbi:MAG: CocE/NonD family hydrolase [Chloroflexi bacterium]|nr:CocE/NonD family hydrolase [Chloroflexota bacterium]MBP8056030.1 CocE/NonD family hydrolase [Chloroflexota bacterium]